MSLYYRCAGINFVEKNFKTTVSQSDFGLSSMTADSADSPWFLYMIGTDSTWSNLRIQYFFWKLISKLPFFWRNTNRWPDKGDKLSFKVLITLLIPTTVWTVWELRVIVNLSVGFSSKAMANSLLSRSYPNLRCLRSPVLDCLPISSLKTLENINYPLCFKVTFGSRSLLFSKTSTCWKRLGSVISWPPSIMHFIHW